MTPRRHSTWLSALLLLAALPVAAQPVWADARDQVLLNLARCGAIAEARTWLDCYYGAAQPMRAQLGLSPAPQSQQRLVPLQPAPSPLPAPAIGAQAAAPPPMRRENKGGFWNELVGGKALVTNMRAAAYSFDARGIFTITLADGEVWQQLSNDDSYAQWNKPAARYLVSISEGSLGSHNLQVSGDNRRYKVRRVR